MWEKALIGTVIADPSIALEVLDITSQDFLTNQHKIIWSAIQELVAVNGLSKRSLIESLRQTGELDSIGTDKARGENYIEELVSLSDGRGIKKFAHEVMESSDKWRLEKLGQLLILEARDGKTSREIIEDHIKELLKIQRVGVSDPRPIGSLIPGFDERIMNVREGKIKHLRPPIQNVRDVVGVITDVDFQIIVGKSGNGKSSMLRADGLELAMEGYPVLTLSLENSREETLGWAISHIAQINNTKIINPRLLSNKDLEKIDEAKEKISKIPWYVVEIGSATLVDLTAIVHRLKVRKSLALIQVDGMYLIKGSGEDYSRISNNAQGLRSLAQDLHTPVQATTQFTKKGKFKDEPTMDDLLYAGENPARQIISINNKKISRTQLESFPENWEEGKPIQNRDMDAVVVYVDVLKNTNGRTGKSKDIKWIKPTNTFQSLQADWINSVSDKRKEMIENYKKTYPR
jgi:replicative DNA helicase